MSVDGDDDSAELHLPEERPEFVDVLMEYIFHYGKAVTNQRPTRLSFPERAITSKYLRPS